MYELIIALRSRVSGIILGVQSLLQKTPRDDGESSPKASTSSYTTDQCYNSVSLKKFKLPLFYGDIRQWREYFETFKSAVHERPYHLTDKLNYLYDSLKGDALAAVRGYDKVPDNYNTILDMLVERFGDPEKLMQAYYSDLLNMSPAQTSASQRANLDTIRKIARLQV